MEILLIAAMTPDQVIGLNNTIPWHIPEEQAYFKRVTMGHALLMGRKTYESIGHPLKGRRNIIVTRQQDYTAPGCLIVHSLKQGVRQCLHEKKVFIIGGEQLYTEGLRIADTLMLTVIDTQVDGDTYFPSFSEDDFPFVSSTLLQTASLSCSLQIHRRTPSQLSACHSIKSKS